ncbi:hypothetical protein, partial [Fluoribacter gormanii]|uniref:hypothetical protein n=1 Tax=Fluoribacter gormanii TaxID=464 RepID=UPI001A94DD91
ARFITLRVRQHEHKDKMNQAFYKRFCFNRGAGANKQRGIRQYVTEQESACNEEYNKRSL